MHLVWDFFQNEILGMKWLNRLIGSGLELLGLDTSGRVGRSIQFFIYDTIKIMVLLGILILLISLKAYPYTWISKSVASVE